MSDTIRKITVHYASSVTAYRDHWAPVLVRVAGPLFEAIPRPSGSPVLDLGCGIGTLLSRFESLAGSAGCVVGGDPVRQMLRLARTLAPEAALTLLDASRLPFRDKAFGFIGCIFVLQHVREKHRALAEAYRALRPGGHIALATWGRRDPGSPAFALWDDLLVRCGAPNEDPDPPPRWNEDIDTNDGVGGLLSSVGFESVRVWTETREYSWTPETLASYRLNIGAAYRQFKKLSPQAQKSFVKTAQKKLGTLRPEDFLWRPDVVFALASRPQSNPDVDDPGCRSGELDHRTVCPNCGAPLYDRGCKTRCPRCHYFSDCSDPW